MYVSPGNPAVGHYGSAGPSYAPRTSESPSLSAYVYDEALGITPQAQDYNANFLSNDGSSWIPDFQAPTSYIPNFVAPNRSRGGVTPDIRLITTDLPTSATPFNTSIYSPGPGLQAPFYHSPSAPPGTLSPSDLMMPDLDMSHSPRHQDSSSGPSPRPRNSSNASRISYDRASTGPPSSPSLLGGGNSSRSPVPARGMPPVNQDQKYICKFSADCVNLTFDRKCEWR